MIDPEKMIRNLKRRRLRLVILAVVCVAVFCCAVYCRTMLMRYEDIFSLQWFRDQIAGVNPEISLPLILFGTHRSSAIYSHMVFVTFFQFVLFGVLLGTLLRDIFASPYILKVAMWEKIKKLEAEIDMLKKEKRDQPSLGGDSGNRAAHRSAATPKRLKADVGGEDAQEE